MSPCDDGIGEFRLQSLIGDGNPCFLEQAAHFSVPDVPGIHKVLQLLLKAGIMIIDIQTDDMDILLLVFCGEFDSGDDFGNRGRARAVSCPVPQAAGIAYSLIQSVYGVVIGEGKGRQPLFHGIVYKLSGSKAAVGMVGMYMQINCCHGISHTQLSSSSFCAVKIVRFLAISSFARYSS